MMFRNKDRTMLESMSRDAWESRNRLVDLPGVIMPYLRGIMENQKQIISDMKDLSNLVHQQNLRLSSVEMELILSRGDIQPAGPPAFERVKDESVS